MCRLGTESVGGHNATIHPSQSACSAPPFLVNTEDLPDVLWIFSFGPSGPLTHRM